MQILLDYTEYLRLDRIPQALNSWVFTFCTWGFQLNLLSRRTCRYFRL